MKRLLIQASMRHGLRHPLQVALSVLAVALGVAVVVAVDLARESARRSFQLSAQAVSGGATHAIVGGPAGLPEDVYRILRVQLGVRNAAPVVEGWVRAGTPARTLHVVGVDPFAEAPFRAFLNTRIQAEGVRLLRPAAVLLSGATARELAVLPGDTFPVLHAGATKHVVLAGVLETADATSRRALADLMLMDIASAQVLLARTGVLERIDLRVEEGAAGAAELARIKAALPASARIMDASAHVQATTQLTRAFDINLTALSLVALLFGMFLIYNAMTFSVLQRRSLIALLRAQGVTRAEIFTLILSESFVLGIVATGLGIFAGILLGSGLVRLVTRTINDFYYTVSVSGVTVTGWSLIKAGVLGVGATLVASLPPAREAAFAMPRTAWTRSFLETHARGNVTRAALLAVTLLVLGSLLLAVSQRNLITSFVALTVVMFAGALLAPAATVGLMRLVRPIAGKAFGLPGRMAARGVVATLSRTAPAVAALAVALAVGIAMGVMIRSFRGTVAAWLEHALQADIYISTPASTQNRVDTSLHPEFVRRIVATPGVAGVTTYRNVVLPAAEGELRLVAVDLFFRHRAAFHILEGNAADVWTAFALGAVLVSEPLAYHRQLHPGDSLTIPTDRGDRRVRIAAVFQDFASEHGTVYLNRRNYDAWFDDPTITSVAVFVQRGIDPDSLIPVLRARSASAGDILFQPNRALRQGSLDVFDRTFRVTVVLRALALIVAFVGVLGALMALQLERVRELGVLRATGFTPTQVRALIAGQTTLMGLTAGLIALPLGLALAWIMIYVVNRRSFGWTISMQLDADIFLQSLALALAAALLAGLYPAWRLARTSPAAALREE